MCWSEGDNKKFYLQEMWGEYSKGSEAGRKVVMKWEHNKSLII